MNKYVVYFWGLTIFLLTSCSLIPHHSKKVVHRSPSKVILTGWLTDEQLLNQLPAYKAEHDQYQPDREFLEELKKLSTNVHILVFLGTWCPDCQREVPRFLNIMESVQNPKISYKLLGLDRSKRDAAGLAQKHLIEFVPTFVVLQNDEEIGRIVEKPMVSIEQDLVEIFASVK